MHTERGGREEWQSGRQRRNEREDEARFDRDRDYERDPERDRDRDRGFDRDRDEERERWERARYGTGRGNEPQPQRWMSGYGPSQGGQWMHGNQGYGGYGTAGGYGGYAGSSGYGTDALEHFGGGPSFRSPGGPGMLPTGVGPSGSRWYGQESSGQPRVNREWIGKGPRGCTRTDARIEEEVHDRLSRGYVDATFIEVLVKNGEVTLSGSVSSKQDRRMAEDLIEDMHGVKDVTNHLKVRREDDGEHRERGPTSGPSTSSSKRAQT